MNGLFPIFRTIPLYSSNGAIKSYALVDASDHDFLVNFGSWYLGNRYPQIVDKTELTMLRLKSCLASLLISIHFLVH